MVQTGFPIFLDNSPTGICDQILWLVKHSNLNFNAQETPFSLNICLKKCFINKWPSRDQTGHFSEQAQKVETEKDVKINIFEKTVKDLNEEIATLKTKLEDDEKFKVTSENEEKRLLQIKHEKVCAENKALKNDNEAFRKDLNIANVALKTSKKESRDTSHRLDKKIEKLEENIQSLNEYKIVKESEEKDFRAKTKKADKKQKQIQEREAKLRLEKIALQKSEMKNFEASKLHTSSENLAKKSLLQSNHDAQNNVETPFKSVSSSTTSSVYDILENDVTLIHAKADSNPSMDEPKVPDHADDHGNISDTIKVEPISTASAPLTKDDLKEVWEFFAERSERIKSWGGST